VTKKARKTVDPALIVCLIEWVEKFIAKGQQEHTGEKFWISYMKAMKLMWTSGHNAWTKGQPMPSRDQEYRWLQPHRKAQACSEGLSPGYVRQQAKRRVMEARKSRVSKAQYSRLWKIALNKLMKAFDERQHPVFIFTIEARSSGELFHRAAAVCGLVKYLANSAPIAYHGLQILCLTCRRFRKTIWQGTLKDKLDAHFKPPRVDAEVQMLEAQLMMTEKLAAARMLQNAQSVFRRCKSNNREMLLIKR